MKSNKDRCLGGVQAKGLVFHIFHRLESVYFESLHGIEEDKLEGLSLSDEQEGLMKFR